MLNDAKLRAALPQAKPYKLTDANRLYLLVTSAGGRLWRWNYVYDGKQKTLALGAYPVVGLKAARSRRDEARALLEVGKDPGIERKLRVKANIEASRNTFEKVARAWHDTAKTQWATRHSDDILRGLARDVFPSIGSLPIGDLNPPKILEVLRAIEARGAIEAAKRTRQRISAVFLFAIAEGMANHDPAEKLGAALKPLKKGRQPAITALPALRRMLDDAEHDYARPLTRLALRLLALTAVRPSELRGARWEEFEDLNGVAPLWRIPAARMKGDLERKEEAGGDHFVPLAVQSVAVLKALWPLTGRHGLLFPSERRADRPISENAIGYLLNRAGYRGRHVPHGFRAAFSTIMNEWSEREGKPSDRKIIDLMLAHVPKERVEAAYNRAAYMPRRRELAQIWADLLTTRLPEPRVLVERPCREMGKRPRRRLPMPVAPDFHFPRPRDSS